MKFVFPAVAAAFVLMASGVQAQTVADLKPPADISDAESDARMNEIDTLVEEGGVLLEQQKFSEAVVKVEKALGISETYFGEGPYTAWVLSVIGVFYANDGQYEKAEAAYKRSIYIRTALYSAESEENLGNYLNLGILYRNIGRLEEAEPALKLALKIREATQSTDLPSKAYVLDALAQLYVRMGRQADADLILKQADEAE